MIGFDREEQTQMTAERKAFSWFPILVALILGISWMPGQSLATTITIDSGYFLNGWEKNVKFSYNNDEHHVRAGEFSFSLDGTEGIFGFCVDIDQKAAKPGNSYEASLEELTTDGAYHAAWLMDNYSVENAVTAAGLQLAIWQAFFGDFFKVTKASDSVENHYNQYMSGLQDYLENNGDFSDLNYVVAVSEDYQDILIKNPVPEPATIVLLGFGLAGLFALRTRSARRRR